MNSRVPDSMSGGEAELFDHQGSGVLSSIVWGNELIDNPPGRTIGDFRHYLMKRGVPWSDVLGKGNRLRMAYQLKMADPDTILTENGEVAFFPR